MILQPLIYNDPDFVFWLKAQRSAWVRWASPDLELVFSAGCSTDNAALKSVAPADTKLENLESRMIWIRAAARRFHDLMQSDTAYMEREISTIAGWVSLADR